MDGYRWGNQSTIHETRKLDKAKCIVNQFVLILRKSRGCVAHGVIILDNKWYL